MLKFIFEVFVLEDKLVNEDVVILFCLVLVIVSIGENGDISKGSVMFFEKFK